MIQQEKYSKNPKLIAELDAIEKMLIEEQSNGDGSAPLPEPGHFGLYDSDLKKANDLIQHTDQENKRIDSRNEKIDTFQGVIFFGLVFVDFILLVAAWEWLILSGFATFCFWKLMQVIDNDFKEKNQEYSEFVKETLLRQERFNRTYAKCKSIRDRRVKQIAELKLQQCKDDWLSLDPYIFETKIADLFECNGYKARRTRGSNDGGVDIILTSDDERIAVQCKRYTSPVSPSVIRELNGVVNNPRMGFTSGIVVSTGGFSQAARKEAKEMNIELYGMPQIMKMVDALPDEYEQETIVY